MCAVGTARVFDPAFTRWAKLCRTYGAVQATKERAGEAARAVGASWPRFDTNESKARGKCTASGKRCAPSFQRNSKTPAGGWRYEKKSIACVSQVKTACDVRYVGTGRIACATEGERPDRS